MLVVDVLAQVVLTLELLRTEHTPVRRLAPARMRFPQPNHTSPQTMPFSVMMPLLKDGSVDQMQGACIHMMK
jgi:hypothetical protein